MPLTLLLAAGDLTAQQIRTVPDYLPGREYELRLAMSIEDARDDPPQKSYETNVKLRVERKGTRGTDLDWVAGRATGRSAAERQDPILEMVEHIFEDLHLTVNLDPDGKYAGIANEAELRAKIQEFVLLLVPQAAARIPDAAQRRQAEAAMAKLLTPEALLSAARKEIDLYFGISGLPLELGSPLHIQSSALNPFGELGSVEAEMQITPIEIDTVNEEAIVEFRQEFDPGKISASGTGSGQSLEPALAGNNLLLTDSGDFVLDLSSGRVKSVRHVRTIRQDGETVRVETTEITLQ